MFSQYVHGFVQRSAQRPVLRTCESVPVAKLAIGSANEGEIHVRPILRPGQALPPGLPLQRRAQMEIMSLGPVYLFERLRETGNPIFVVGYPSAMSSCRVFFPRRVGHRIPPAGSRPSIPK